MFKPEVWAIIYNRFKTDKYDSSTWEAAGINKAREEAEKRGSWLMDLKWFPEMSAADWWTFYELGDLTKNDERIVAEVPLLDKGFWARLHHAYANNIIFFTDKDEMGWYEEWIKPFDDPLAERIIAVYTKNPRDYMNSARNYFDNEAPVEMMNQKNFDMNNPAVLWEWHPTQKNNNWQAINKQKVV